MDNNGINRSNKKRKIERTLDENIDDNQQSDQFSDQRMKVPEISNPYQNSSAYQSPADLPDGTQQVQLGSGVICSMLGEGGMARVYKIWNEQLEVFRAVKIFHSTGQPGSRKRFETEIKISAKLHHPNIIETYSVGEWNKLPYIEMELVEGMSLESLIENHGKLPLAVCVAVGIQVSKALNYAHTQEFLLYGKTYKGIIHRDLKPANIMLSKNGAVKILDFGIARPTEVGLHTVAGNIVGTLPYLSPEQLDDEEIDQRSDIYSLGTVLYEALTGEKTFPQSSVTGLMKNKMINSYRKFDSFSTHLSPQLEKVIEKSLSHEKKDRYTTAAQMREALSTVYQKLSSEDTETILQNYFDDPAGFSAKAAKKEKKKIRFSSPAPSSFSRNTLRTKIVAGASALVLILAATVTFFSVRSKGPDKVSKPVSDDVTKVAESKPKQTDSPKVEMNVVVDSVPPKDSAPEKSPEDLGEKAGKDTKTSPPKPKPSPRPAPKKKLSHLDKLRRSYSTDNMVEIGEKAVKSSKYTDAILALENMPENHPKAQRGKVLLAKAYLETRQIKKASAVTSGLSDKDGYLILLKGRVAFAKKQNKEALHLFEKSLTIPSVIENIQKVRSDALYYTALSCDRIHASNPSPGSKQRALTAWNNLKRMYASRPNHPRFKLANKKLASY
ncbi:MAG: protein kinase domain-containing protein [Chitinispirillaceae bacterium]